MPGSPPPSGPPLSERARQILRSADAQIAAEGTPDPWAQVEDLGRLLDLVAAGLAATRAHADTLAAALERIADELERRAPG